jgi:hypothetical protein
VCPGAGLEVLEIRKKFLASAGIRTTDHTVRTIVAVEILNIAHRPRLINQHASLMDMPPSSDGKEKVGNLFRWVH